MATFLFLSSLAIFFFFFVSSSTSTSSRPTYVSSSTSASSRPTYNVLKFGAKADGKTDSSQAFLSAWNSACASAAPPTIYVPKGQFLIRSAAFWGQSCRNHGIRIQIDGTLVAPSDYNVNGNSGHWIKFESVTGLSISGGILDGQGSRLWSCKASGGNCPDGATSLAFYNSNNVAVEGLTSLNSQMFHIVIDGCHNTNLQGIKISASGNSPNTDGIHVQKSSSVTILGSRIATGDDCVSLGPGSSNVWIEGVSCGPGHGISIGSLGWDVNEPGVQNVTVKSVTFTGTKNGVRVKTWARNSNGYVKNVLFQHLTMINVQNPIIVDQNYCPDKRNCPGMVSGVTISDLTYQDIHGTSATQVAVKFDCSRKHPCSGIRLQDVNLSYKNQQAQASCSNAGGKSYGVQKPTSCL